MDYIVKNNLQTNNCVDVKLTVFIINDTSHEPSCGNQVRTWCTATCHDNSKFNRLLQEAKNSHNDSGTYKHRFYLFLWASIVSWVGMAVVVSIADAICFDLLGLCHVAKTSSINIELYFILIYCTRFRLREKKRLWETEDVG